ARTAPARAPAPIESSTAPADPRGRASASRPAGEALDDLPAERGEVAGLAAADEGPVDVDLLVDPASTGVDDVGAQAGPRRQRALPYGTALHERPGAVADDAHGRAPAH